MELGNVYINKKLTPITLTEINRHLNTFQPIFENKICDSLFMNYTKSATYPSTDIPALVPVIYSTTTDKVTISALFEINIANSYTINVHAKKTKPKQTIHYAENKLSNYPNTEIVEHFIIHDITNYDKKIIDKWRKLNKIVGEQPW